MKAITLWQPWASLIVYGHKHIETRSWPTKYRGWLGIHASQKLVIPDDPGFVEQMERAIGNPLTLPRGAVVGCCQIVDCRETKWLVEKIHTVQSQMIWGDFSE